MNDVPPVNPIPAAVAPTSDVNVHSPAGNTEEVYYEGTPRLRGHLGHVLIYGILGILVILMPTFWHMVVKDHPMHLILSLIFVLAGIIILIIPILIVKRTRYRITNYRIDFERGWLSTTINTIELWHVEDIKFHQSIFERMLEVGTIEVESHDKETPSLFMRGIPHARQLFTTLEQRIIAVKRQQGVLKVDMGQ